MKLDKLEKLLGSDTVKDLENMSTGILKDTIYCAEQAMKEAKDELEANPKYVELKESLGALTAGLKEVNKRQRAIIAYSLHLIEEKGKSNE